MFLLALSNLWQRKTRTFLTAAGFVIATATLFALLAFERGYRRGLEQELQRLGAHILVVPKGCPYDAASLALHGANWPCYLKEEYLTQVRQTAGVRVAAPVFMAAGYGESRQVIVGITPEYLRLRPLWQIRGQFPATTNEVLLGSDVALRLRAQEGALVHLENLAETRRVSGVLDRTAGPEDDFAFLHLADAQQSFKRPGLLTHVLVKLDTPESLEATVQALRGCDAGMQMNVVPLAHLFETIRQVSASAKYLLAGLSAVAFLIAGSALANTMLMAVLERTREIGVLRAVGASMAQIFWLVVAETVLLAAVGSAFGVVLALACSRGIEQWARGQIAYAPRSALISLDIPAGILACGFALLISLAVAILPAWRAARLDPVAAFRVQNSY